MEMEDKEWLPEVKEGTGARVVVVIKRHHEGPFCDPVLYLDCIGVSILVSTRDVVVVSTRDHHDGKLGKGNTRFPCIVSYNCM